MALQDDIAADQSAVEAAQAALDAANARLADDKAKLDALQPHLSVFQEMRAAAQKYGGEAAQEFEALIARGEALLGL